MGGGSEGGLVKDHTFYGFFSAPCLICFGQMLSETIEMKKNQWSTQLCMLILINSRINILGDVTYGCQQNGSTVQNVDSMGMPESTNGDIPN